MDIDLVLSGSGTRFPVYIGALRALEEKNIEIQRVAGTSGGALIAICIAMKKTADELLSNVLSVDFNTLKDFSLFSLVTGYGLYKGDVLEKMVDQLTKGITFRYLPIDCYVFASDPSNVDFVVFSKEHTPDMKLSTAIRYSASVPLVFAYKKWEQKYIVDGLLYANYPIDFFKDSPRQVIGLRMNSNINTKHFNRLNIFEYVFFLVESLIVSIENEDIKDYPQAKTITLNTKYNSLNFNVSNDEKVEMFQLGYEVTKQYLEGIL